MSSLTNLTHLRLVGGGMNGPFPLIPLLRLCPTLTELVLGTSFELLSLLPETAAVFGRLGYGHNVEMDNHHRRHRLEFTTKV